MKVLALEFSTLRRSAALLDFPNSQSSILDSQFSIISTAEEEPRRGGSPFPLISRVLGPHQPDALAIGLGPGSYTGIRSALAIAQGWHLAHQTPAAGASSADAIAHKAWSTGHRGPIEVAIDAQRSELYSACYELTDTGLNPTEPLEIRSTPRHHGQLIGPDATRWDSNGIKVFPAAAAIARLSVKTAFTPPEKLSPIYLREPSFVKAAAPRIANL